MLHLKEGKTPHDGPSSTKRQFNIALRQHSLCNNINELFTIKHPVRTLSFAYLDMEPELPRTMPGTCPSAHSLHNWPMWGLTTSRSQHETHLSSAVKSDGTLDGGDDREVLNGKEVLGTSIRPAGMVRVTLGVSLEYIRMGILSIESHVNSINHRNHPFQVNKTVSSQARLVPSTGRGWDPRPPKSLDTPTTPRLTGERRGGFWANLTTLTPLMGQGKCQVLRRLQITILKSIKVSDLAKLTHTQWKTNFFPLSPQN